MSKNLNIFRQRAPLETRKLELVPRWYALRVDGQPPHGVSCLQINEEAAVRDLLKVMKCEVIMLVGYSDEQK